MQARYKRDFDKKVKCTNRTLRVGDLVYLDTRHTSIEKEILGRSRNKLDFKSQGPYVILEIKYTVYTILVGGAPYKVNSDRIRPASCPKSMFVEDASDLEKGESGTLRGDLPRERDASQPSPAATGPNMGDSRMELRPNQSHPSHKLEIQRH